MREKFVCDERGFLLIEHLISLLIVGILSVMIVTLLQVVSSYSVNPNHLTMHEVETLATRIQNEARLASSLSAGDDELFLHFSEDRVVNFSVRNNNRMVRQVNGVGGEIATYNLRSMDVNLIGEGTARLRLVSIEGEVFYMYITVLVAGLAPIDIGGGDDDDKVCVGDGDEDEICDESEDEI